MEKSDTTKSQNKNGGFKTSAEKLRAKLLNSYYGNPIKDMKLITITGCTNKTTVAHFVHEILRASGEQVAVLASDKPFKTAMLHKFLNDAWKAGANYVIVTTPNEAIKNNVFYGLPIHIAAITNFTTPDDNEISLHEFIQNEKILFNSKPTYVVTNADDPNCNSFTGTKSTVSYGQISTDIKILNSKLYKKGSEATISADGEFLNVATFVPGENAVSAMACATAVARILDISNNKIVEGIANYDPNEIQK